MEVQWNHGFYRLKKYNCLLIALFFIFSLKSSVIFLVMFLSPKLSIGMNSIRLSWVLMSGPQDVTWGLFACFLFDCLLISDRVLSSVNHLGFRKKGGEKWESAELRDEGKQSSRVPAPGSWHPLEQFAHIWRQKLELNLTKEKLAHRFFYLRHWC